MNKRWISSEDIRQFVYCKRKIYWRDIANFRQNQTKLMNLGLEFHNKKIKQISKNKITEYREYYLTNESLKLVAVADYIIEHTSGLIITEHKNQYALDYINHGSRMQLVFIAYLAEQHFEKKILQIEIRTNNGRKVTDTINKTDYDKLFSLISEIRELYLTPIIPEACGNTKQCAPCEYHNICTY